MGLLEMQLVSFSHSITTDLTNYNYSGSSQNLIDKEIYKLCVFDFNFIKKPSVVYLIA